MKNSSMHSTVGIRQYFRKWIPVICSLFIIACNPPPAKTKAQVISERIKNRVTKWQANVEAKCTREVMEKATAIVDSTIKANARAQKDTLFRPIKPGHPDYTIPEDSIPIAPLIVIDSVSGDTLFKNTLELELLKLLEGDTIN